MTFSAMQLEALGRAWRQECCGRYPVGTVFMPTGAGTAGFHTAMYGSAVETMKSPRGLKTKGTASGKSAGDGCGQAAVPSWQAMQLIGKTNPWCRTNTSSSMPKIPDIWSRALMPSITEQSWASARKWASGLKSMPLLRLGTGGGKMMSRPSSMMITLVWK